MKQVLVTRLKRSLLVILGVSLLSFLFVHLSGDPAALMLPPDASSEQVAALRQSMGLNDPLWQQYLRFMSQAVKGDFGTSIRHRESALRLILGKLPATLELAAASLAIALLVAVPLGVYTAARRGTLGDYAGSLLGVLGQSMPVFWLGLMLQLLFGLLVPILPMTGRGSFEQLILPSISLGLYSVATIMRLLKSNMLDVLQQDYIRTARAKGLSQRLVMYKHALRNALLPVVTVVGMQIGVLLGGAVITENIFAWPGVGRLMVQAISNRDLPLVQAGVFVLAVGIVLVNLVTDLLYTWLDPRIRLHG